MTTVKANYSEGHLWGREGVNTLCESIRTEKPEFMACIHAMSGSETIEVNGSASELACSEEKISNSWLHTSIVEVSENKKPAAIYSIR